MGFGEVLREARERRGLSLEDGEAATKIRKRYLAALESEDVRVLPPPVYARGFLRSYAAFLGLDPEALVALYPHQPEPILIRPTPSMERPPSGRFYTWVPVVAVIVLLILVGGYLVGGDTIAAIDEPSVTATPQLPAVVPTLRPFPTYTPTPSPSPTPTVTPTPAPLSVEILVRAVAASWVSVAVDGKDDFAGTLNKDDSRTFKGKEKVVLRTGNAGGLDITFNGKPQGLLGQPGQLVIIEWGAAGFNLLTPTPTRTPRPVTATPTPPPAPSPAPSPVDPSPAPSPGEPSPTAKPAG